MRPGCVSVRLSPNGEPVLSPPRETGTYSPHPLIRINPPTTTPCRTVMTAPTFPFLDRFPLHNPTNDNSVSSNDDGYLFFLPSHPPGHPLLDARESVSYVPRRPAFGQSGYVMR